ncbi:MAG: amidase [Acidocella sp. 20-57-95]|nr:MAG: amidase [Acidocella sp. 20-57-95]OYV62378.1 MAG: amidase [Acidocella sp. 21-58-7]HQT63092.1 amidase [Acidocella sp.]HQU03811.1 amidase [Acidocella sp.]
MDTAFATARRIASLIKAGKISALEVTDFYIARIEAFDDALNAVVVRDFDRARAQAKSLDRTKKKHAKLPPLYGVPMTLKESFDVAGLPTTWGVEAARDNIAKTDAIAVQRFKAAGAVVLGKTNVPVMLADWQSSNPIYGTSNNPWDMARSPGGSSGGSAASLAAGFSALDAGSDIGNSLRDPAHYCGIYAHKPTYGICAMRGHSLSGSFAPPDISCIGPMARSAGDLALGLSVMAGPEEIEAGWQLALPKSTVKSLKGLRVAIMADHPLCPVETEISDAMLELGKFLKKSGAKVNYTARPDFDAAAVFENYMLLLNSALSARMPDKVIDKMRQMLNTAADETSPGFMTARGVLLEHRLWLRENEERARLRTVWADFFKDYDVLISPAASTAAVPHDHSGNMSERSILVNGEPMIFGQQLFWAGYSCNFGLPSTAAPLGFTQAGLPFGMQIIGAPYADATTIAVAGLLEKDWLGFVAPLAYDL